MLLFSVYWQSHLLIFTHPPHFLLYLHLYFTPFLSCCLDVMWSRTDAGSPNCGTAISAPLRLLGSLSETEIGDAPPSPSASKREKGGRESGKAGHPAISQNSDDPSEFLHFQNEQLHICSAAENIQFRGLYHPQDGGWSSLWRYQPPDMFVMENAVCRYCVITPRMKPAMCGSGHSGLLADCPCVG